MSLNWRIKNKISNAAFTLVELLVALGLFAVAMTVAVGAVLSVVDANAKAQATQSVMNNLNIAIDGMLRSVRMGTFYTCGSNTNLFNPGRDCSSLPSTKIAFKNYEGNFQAYYLNGKQIYRILCDTPSYVSDPLHCSNLPITAPDISIDRFDIYVNGAEYTYPNDAVQPVAVFIIEGTAASQNISSSLYGKKKKTRVNFKIQTVATQRILDL